MRDVMKRVMELEQKGTPVAYIPEDGSSLVEGQGYRVAIVVAGEGSYSLTGDWPYTGRVDQKMPWFWGPTLEAAQAEAVRYNRRVGVSAEEAALVIARSMARSTRPRGVRSL